MSRIKGRYVAQLSIDIDTPYNDQDSGPIAEVKERFRTVLTPLIRENLQKGVGSDAAVNLVEQYLDVYEVIKAEGSET